MDLPTEYKTLANIRPSSFPIEQTGIIFQDKRIPQSLSFGIAVLDVKKEISVQRSHSICPSKDHFIDKHSFKKNLRYTASPNLGSHVSGSDLEKGRRTELGKNLLNIKEKVADNQFHLTMLFQRGDTRLNSFEIKTKVHDLSATLKATGKFYSEKSDYEINNLKKSNELRSFNMDLNDYKNRSNLKFKNVDNFTNLNSEPVFLFPDFNLLSINEEFERFPKQKVLDNPKQMRNRIGLSVHSSLSNSSSDEKYKIPQRVFSEKASNTRSYSPFDLEGWCTSSSHKTTSSSDARN